MKNLYELLKPNIQTTIEINALKYDSDKKKNKRINIQQ